MVRRFATGLRPPNDIFHRFGKGTTSAGQFLHGAQPRPTPVLHLCMYKSPSCGNCTSNSTDASQTPRNGGQCERRHRVEMEHPSGRPSTSEERCGRHNVQHGGWDFAQLFINCSMSPQHSLCSKARSCQLESLSRKCSASRTHWYKTDEGRFSLSSKTGLQK